MNRMRTPSPPAGALRLTPPSSRAHLWLFVTTLCVPVLCAAVSTALSPPQARVLPQGIALSTPMLALAVPAAVLLVGLMLWGLLAAALRRQSLSIEERCLTVRSTFFRTRVDLDALLLDQARVVDLDERREWRPWLKVRGFSLPGLRSGWYRLRDRRKAFVAIAGSHRVLALPTTAGHALLLDVPDPARLLQRLRALAGPARPG